MAQIIDAPARAPVAVSVMEAGAPLGDAQFFAIRRRMVLDFHKWDPQVGDQEVLVRFPVILAAREWNRLAKWAEAMTAEAVAVEQKILRSAAAIGNLGLPAALATHLSRMPYQQIRSSPRIMRFDFHWTQDGWRISESNSDVPGGYTEASEFARLMADHYSHAFPTGDPGTTWVEEIVAAAGRNGTIAILCAPGFMEDMQIVSYLAARLLSKGIDTRFAAPRGFEWAAGQAFLRGDGRHTPVSLIVRFYQGEWLARLPGRDRWKQLLEATQTIVANPPQAILTESKRFSLVWKMVGADMPTWRALLPETRDPRDAPWQSEDGWIIKPAYGNTGDHVTIPSMLCPQERRRRARLVMRQPAQWVAQRRFHTAPLRSSEGPLYPCIGVYTINGRAAGSYGRVSSTEIIDFQARDIAVLLQESEGLT